MKNAFKYVVSMILVLSLLFCVAVPTLAAEKDDEEYLSDLRIIYADTYSEAADILKGTSLDGYKLFNANLNEGTEKIGVWIAYKTTTDIEDAITDIAVMQMNGGYKEGNYKAMIEQSYNEYVAVGETYLDAIEYFVKAYNADDFLAESVYRQLNLYTGLDGHDGERLGDILLGDVTSTELATLFMQGNKYVLSNVRSLLSMGVSYNEDGTHYLARVATEAEKMSADPNIYASVDYDELASVIAGNVLTFGKMFSELSNCEDELNYTDEEFTDKELQYVEYQSLADRMREINYLGGKTLYDFCLEYKFDSKDLTSLYPLVAALNDGQVAMTLVSHYYDVVLYSMSDLPEENILEELLELEEKYADIAFDVYSGVDRSIYKDTFALTSAAYRADAYTESGFWSSLVDPSNGWGIATLTTASISLACTAWGIYRTVKANMLTSAAKNYVSEAEFAFNTAVLESAHRTRSIALIATNTRHFIYDGKVELAGKVFDGNNIADDVVNALFDKVFPNLKDANHGFDTKILMLKSATGANRVGQLNVYEEAFLDDLLINGTKDTEHYILMKHGLEDARRTAAKTTQLVNKMSKLTNALYIAGGVSMVASAITLSISVYNYYNPSYDDIPTAMVDLIDTVDGDRYIKYDVVYEAEARADGNYAAADLNAFKANRWNALYYTKSYEAGKPLLADEFALSNTSNTPAKNYMPVHRFGEVVSYNLNKYNFNDDLSIYLSVKQSENNKAAVGEVPEVVGAVFSKGLLIIAGGIGAIAGIGGVICTQDIIKKKKASAEKKGRG